MGRRDAAKGKRTVAGSPWRVLAHGKKRSYRYGTPGAGDPSLKGPPCIFDELVVGDWLHVEQMDDREWWARLGDARIWISVRARGRTRVYIDRGEYGPALGRTGSVMHEAPVHRAIARGRGKR